MSVVVCTRDRAGYLARALDSLRRQTLDPAAREVVVVDDGSRDGTAALLAGAAAGLPGLRVLRVPAAGLARARNAGWAAARGALVAFLDDDAVADPAWLARLVEAGARAPAGTGLVTGPVRPIWEAPRPPWLPDELLGCLTLVDWGPEPAVLRAEQWIAGCNLAVPRALLERAGGFPPGLGRRGRRLLSMEDTALRERLEGLGHRCWYDPGVLVHHHVPPGRLTRRWILRRVYWNGVSAARAARLAGPAPRPTLAPSLRALGRALRARLLVGRGATPAERFRLTALAAGRLGVVAGRVGG